MDTQADSQQSFPQRRTWRETPLGAMVNGGLINHVWRNVNGVRNEQTAVVLWNSSVRLNIIEPRHDKTNKMAVRPPKTQISLGIRPVWSESSLCAQWVAKDPSFLHGTAKTDLTGRTVTLLVLSCRGSYLLMYSPFLAHLSQRLTRWTYRKGLEPASVRPSVRPSTLSNMNISETGWSIAGRLQSDFIWSLTGVGERLH